MSARLVVSSGPAIRAMAAATGVPVLFAISGDAVELGLVKNLARPDSNFTGVTSALKGSPLPSTEVGQPASIAFHARSIVWLPMSPTWPLPKSQYIFHDKQFIPELPAFKNVIVGRTFSKAFGLAGLRIGCLLGAPKVLDPVRAVIPVYSVNVAASVAVRAALEDRAYVDEYVRQVAESKALLYAACDRLGLTYWRSGANFVLVSAGDRAADLVQGAAERGIYLRDRSTEPGCAGCVRIGTGVTEHTRRCIAAMDEVLCAAR